MGSMSDALTVAQNTELCARLRSLKDDLETQLIALDASAQPVELDQSTLGRLSRMSAMQDQAMAVANRSNLRTRRARCATALAAVDRDEYGLCRNCEEPIAYARLAAYPEAPLCITCQSKRG